MDCVNSLPYLLGRGGKSMKNIIAVNNRKYSDEEEDETEPEEEDESWKGQGNRKILIYMAKRQWREARKLSYRKGKLA